MENKIFQLVNFSEGKSATFASKFFYLNSTFIPKFYFLLILFHIFSTSFNFDYNHNAV